MFGIFDSMTDVQVYLDLKAKAKKGDRIPNNMSYRSNHSPAVNYRSSYIV